MASATRKKVAVIIPAYNEEGRISGVVKAAVDCKLASEVLVVSDGSTDKTVQEAGRNPSPKLKVVDLKQNVGKGGAMVEGAKATDADILCFVDADLEGLTGQHIDDIIRPMLNNRVDMCIGVFRGGKLWSEAGHRMFPYVSGQRAIRRQAFLNIPYVSDMRYGVEMTLTRWAKRNNVNVVRVVLRGVSNFHKEQKMGFLKGSAARFKMYQEMYRAVRKDKTRQYCRSKRTRR